MKALERWRRRVARRLARRVALARIRLDLAALGVPIDDLTNEEVEAAVLAFAATLREAGLTAQQATEALVRVAAAAPTYYVIETDHLSMDAAGRWWRSTIAHPGPVGGPDWTEVGWR